MKASREVENARKAVNGNGLRVDVSSALEGKFYYYFI